MRPREIVVIGAGPAGLATAACLAERGAMPRVFERADSVGAAWRNHYARLRLHTVKSLSALPGLPFPADVPAYPSRAQVVDYLEAYARHHRIHPVFGEAVERIVPSDGRWRITTAAGRSESADAVVVATGANQRPRMPSFPGQDEFAGRIVHSRDYRDPAPYADQRVLVVGMGNTGAEIALDLAERGVAVTIAVRSPVNIVRRDVLGRPTQRTSIALGRLPPAIADPIARVLRDLTVGDLGRWGLRTSPQSPLQQLRDEGRTPVIDIGTVARIRRGDIAIRPGIASFTVDGVAFTDDRQEAFDAVVMATGYESGLASLFPDTELQLDEPGLPRETIGTGERAGLAFVGFDIRQPGGLLRTIAAQARVVARALADADLPETTA